MKHLSIRDVPPDLAAALDKARRRSGTSLNQLVKELLRRALGLSAVDPPANDLAAHAGTWSNEQFEEFERDTQDFAAIDPELWR